MLQVSHIWPGENLRAGFYALLTYSSILWHNSVVYVHLVLSLLWLWNRPVFQGALVSFSGKWYLESKTWVLGVLIVIAHCRHCSPCPQYRRPLHPCLASIPHDSADTLLTRLGL